MRNFRAGSPTWELNAVLLATGGSLLGYAKRVELPPLDRLALPGNVSLDAVDVMLDLTAFPQEYSDILPDLSSLPLTFVVRLGSRAELRIFGCLLTAENCIYSRSRLVCLPSARILVPGVPRRVEPFEVG